MAEQASLPVGSCLLDLVNGIEGVLDGGEADGGGPDSGGEAEGDFAAAGGCGGLVEGLEDHLEGGWGDDEGEVVEEFDVDLGGVAGDHAEDGAGADEGGKEGKEEVVAEFGGAGEEIVVHEGAEGALHNYGWWNALEVPEGLEGGVGDLVPDSLAQRVDMSDRVVFAIGNGIVDGGHAGLLRGCGERLLGESDA